MPDEELKAKVFISCGQRPGRERDIAQDIKNLLEKTLGYKAYVATEHQSVEGVPEIILAQLESSEYFLFIDFKRERLLLEDPLPQQVDDLWLSSLPRRGSVFSHQELAVASHLKMPIIAFREKGVERDGLAKFESVNSIGLKEGQDVVKAVCDEIDNRNDWCRDSKNQLRPTIEPAPNNPEYRHIKLENLHHRKHARNCYGHLKRAYDTLRDKEVVFDHRELKWELSRVPNIAIFANTSRRLDAFWVCGSKPGIFLSTYTDVPKQGEHIIKAPGTYKLTYVVISDNFPDAEITCELVIGKYNNVEFTQVESNSE